jgi:ATP-dependent DNA ligase
MTMGDPTSRSFNGAASAATARHRRGARWVAPGLKATIEVAEFTNDGHVRHASFIRLAS